MTSSVPFISIVIPTYNRYKSLERTIQSILNQSWQNFELIIVDDNPPESKISQDIKKYLEQLDFNNIRHIVLPKKSGPSFARNQGIMLSKGDYIAFCDDDVLWEVNKLEIQIKKLSSFDALISACYYHFPHKTKASFPHKRKLLSIQDLYKGGFAGGQLSAFIGKSEMVKNNLFEEQCSIAEDNIFFASLIKKGFNIKMDDHKLVHYYLDDPGQLHLINKRLPANEIVKRIQIAPETQKTLGYYYRIIVAKSVIGANLKTGEISFKRIMQALRISGLFPTFHVIIIKTWNFFIRKLYKNYH